MCSAVLIRLILIVSLTPAALAQRDTVPLSALDLVRNYQW